MTAENSSPSVPIQPPATGARAGSRPDISDAELRDLIAGAARKGRPTEGANTAKSAEVGSDSRKLPNIAAKFALRKIPVGKQSKPQLKWAAYMFVLHWLIGMGVGIAYEHFNPSVTDQAQFVSLLLASLATLTCAIVAYIELFKFTWAGRSVAVGLGFVNFAFHAVLAFYAWHWLIVVGHLFFAVGLAIFISMKSPEDGEVPTTPAKWRVRVGAAIIVVGWLGMIGPAMFYSSRRALAPQLLEQAAAAKQAGNHDEARQIAIRAAGMYQSLVTMADGIGEKFTAKGALLARWGYTLALAGDYGAGYAKLRESFHYGEIAEVYKLKAEVYCLQHGLSYQPRNERTLTEEEKWARERPIHNYDTSREMYFLRTGEMPPDENNDGGVKYPGSLEPDDDPNILVPPE